MALYKKIFTFLTNGIVIFLLIFSLKAVAGGLGYTPTSPVYSGIYFEGNAGFSLADWEEDEPVQNYISLFQGQGAPFGTFNHGKGGFVGNLLIGYQWNKHFGAEIGWARFVTMTYYIPNGTIIGAGSSAKFRTWVGYFALKIMVPFYADNFFMFGKLGVADMTNRVKLDFIPAQGVPGKGDYWAPLFAFGFQYYITWEWSVNLQYMFIPGLPQIPFDGILREAPMPPSNIVTAGLGYKLAI